MEFSFPYPLAILYLDASLDDDVFIHHHPLTIGRRAVAVGSGISSLNQRALGRGQKIMKSARGAGVTIPAAGDSGAFDHGPNNDVRLVGIHK